MFYNVDSVQNSLIFVAYKYSWTTKIIDFVRAYTYVEMTSLTKGKKSSLSCSWYCFNTNTGQPLPTTSIKIKAYLQNAFSLFFNSLELVLLYNKENKQTQQIEND